MNPNEMSLSQCCDWLAENVKKCRRNYPGSGFRQDCPWIGPGPSDLWDTHPVPITFDAIYAAMPKGWIIKWIAHTVTGEPAWCASAFKGPGPDAVDKPYASIRAPDLLTCWARLCVAMWIEENKA